MSTNKIQKFISSWLEEIKKIENRAIDSQGVYYIHLHFRRDRGLVHMFSKEEKSTSDRILELNMLEAKLRVALETARCKYNLQNRGLWARIAQGIGGIVYRIPKEIKS